MSRAATSFPRPAPPALRSRGLHQRSLPDPPSAAPPPVFHRPYWLPRTIRPTRAGWWFIGGTLALGVAAINTGNNLLYLILAMALSVMTISGLLSEQTMRRVRVRREIPQRLFAGTPGLFGVSLVNRKRRLPSYALHLTEPDPGGGPPATQFVLQLPARSEARWRYALTFPRRGRHTLPGIRLSTRFPFGLFSKSSRPIQTDPVLVYPAIRPLAPREIPAALRTARQERRRRGNGTGLHALRPYRPGDDTRLVHWKTSARLGELVVKETEDEEGSTVCLVVEDPAPGTPADAIEADLSLVASVAQFALRRGARVELVTAGDSSGLGGGDAHLDRILRLLALYTVPDRPRSVAAGRGVDREIRVRLGASPSPRSGP